MMLKVHMNPDYPTSNKNLRGGFNVQACFANLFALSMATPITNCLPFFFRKDGNFYQIILSHTLETGRNESLIRKLKCIRDKALRKD